MKNNRRKTGAILITTALLSTFILGLTAIVVDVGYLYSKNNELQTAVNAGWLAGYDRMMHLKGSSSTLTNEAKENIKSHILEVMVHNGFENNQESSLKVEVTDNRLLKVSARSHVGLFFARIIEADSTSISSGRASNQANEADILPIVMPHGIAKWNPNNAGLSFQFFTDNSGFVEGNEYIIKPGEMADNSVMCQGITDFSSNGITDPLVYKDLLEAGYTKVINLNDKLGMVCKGFAAETDAVINSRINSGNRRVIIPLVDTADEALNPGIGPKEFPLYLIRNNVSGAESITTVANAVKVIGFAMFDLLAPSEYQRIGSNYTNDDSGTLGVAGKGQIRGRFIRYIVNPNEVH